MDGYIGQIIMFAGNFAPTNWLFCNGQTLAINQYQALYSIIGNIYGGNGATTFNLPDLRGRVPLHVGQSNAPGATNHALAQSTGAETAALSIAQLPSHNHSLTGTTATITLPAQASSSNPADQTNPNGNIPAVTQASGKAANSYTTPANANGTLSGGGSVPVSLSGNTSPTGNGTPVSLMQPSLCVNFIICTQGIYPDRP